MFGRRLLQLGNTGTRPSQLLLEACELALQAPFAPGVECCQLALDRGDPVLRALLLGRDVGVGRSLLLQHLQLAEPALTALACRHGLLAHPLEPHGDPLARGVRRVQTSLQPLAVARLRGERLLGLLASLRHLAEQPLGLVPLATHAACPLLSLGQRQPGAAGSIA